jgi:hypothetical protein
VVGPPTHTKVSTLQPDAYLVDMRPVA